MKLDKQQRDQIKANLAGDIIKGIGVSLTPEQLNSPMDRQKVVDGAFALAEAYADGIEEQIPEPDSGEGDESSDDETEQDDDPSRATVTSLH